MCLFPSGYTHALKIVIEILIFERSLKMKHQKKPNSNLDFFKDNNHRQGVKPCVIADAPTSQC